MDDAAIRLAKARHLIEAERALRFMAEHELRMARLELARARRIIVGSQRQQTQGTAHAGS